MKGERKQQQTWHNEGLISPGMARMGRSRVGFRVLVDISSSFRRAGLGVMDWELDAGDCGQSPIRSNSGSDGEGGFCILIFHHRASGECAMGRNRTERDRGNSCSVVGWVKRYISVGTIVIQNVYSSVRDGS